MIATQKILSPIDILTQDDIVKIAFQLIKNPRGKVQALFGSQGTGDNRNPQNIKIADIINLWEGVSLQWHEVIRNAIKEIKNKHLK